MTTRTIFTALVLASLMPLSLACASRPAAPSSGPKFLIITDLEGPAGVDHWNQTREPGPAQEAAKVLLTDEVNAAVSGIFDAEPKAIVDVWDGHGPGGLLKDKVHAKARYLRDERPRKSLVAGAYDAVLFVGQHAMSGTPQAALAHTYSSRTIAYYRLNGCFVGELGSLIALAGSRDIPVIFVAGDDKTVMEGQAWVSNMVGAAVKQSQGIESAISLPHDEACRLVRRRAAEACRKRSAIKPVHLDPPYRLEIRYYEPIKSPSKPASSTQPVRTQIDSRTIQLEANDLAELPI
jgi:D-amino peptidase